MKWPLVFTNATLAALMLLLGLYGLPSTAIAQGKDKQKTFSDKAETSPALVNFNTELGLPFASLSQLSGRIRIARDLADPVGLAAVANELAIAEKVSGKQASLTSETLAREAAELAKARFDAQELQAVALLTGRKDLISLAKSAARDAAEQKASAAEGEKTRGLQGTLSVRNETFSEVRIYVDGSQVGSVRPLQTLRITVRDNGRNTTFLQARCKSGTFTWHRTVQGNPTSYGWVLQADN